MTSCGPAAGGARYADRDFITAWTRRAAARLQSLVPEGLAGAMIYTATDHSDFGLLDGDRVTAQGAAFRDLMAG